MPLLEPHHLHEHRGRLLRTARTLCRSSHDAEDLVQDTFERVLRRPRHVAPGCDEPYLLRVLRHTWSASARSPGRRATLPAPPDHFDALADRRADQELATEVRAIRTAMTGLSDPLQRTIVAVDVLGLSYAQAATTLKTRTGTIMSRLSRARDQVARAVAANDLSDSGVATLSLPRRSSSVG